MKDIYDDDDDDNLEDDEDLLVTVWVYFNLFLIILYLLCVCATHCVVSLCQCSVEPMINMFDCLCYQAELQEVVGDEETEDRVTPTSTEETPHSPPQVTNMTSPAYTNIYTKLYPAITCVYEILKRVISINGLVISRL